MTTTVISTAASMKISIITVCYNSVDTIADALKSISRQTCPEIEHIIIDGASRDGTMAVIDGFRDRISRVVSEPDRGIYEAMNKGISLANADLIGFLNADDVYADDHVLEKVAGIMHQENLDMLYGDVAFFHPRAPSRIVRQYRSARFSPAKIAWGWMPAHPALFVHRRLFERVGPFRTDYRIAGDFEFVARVFQSGIIRHRHIPEVLVNMRTGGVSTGGWRNTLMLNREVLRACRENGIKTNLVKILSKYPMKILEYVLP